MKKYLLSCCILVLGTGMISAQNIKSNGNVAANNQTSVSKNNNGTVLDSGTQLSGQLQNSIDVRKAKVGDQVILKTTKAIKQNGQTVVNKGSNIIGKITEVQQKTENNAMSKLSVMFDSIQNGKMISPISATIVSLTQASANVNDNSADVFGSSTTSTSTSSTSGSGGGGGGLLGGVTNTVGGVVNTTTNTVGGVTNTVGQTVGNTTNSLGGTLKGIQITQSTDASAQGGSTLLLQNGNLQLEKGVMFNLRLTESSTIKTSN
ncbi:MAG: hypothetical protein K1X72_24885 [Pyrinomonadaceae bacterium]|nr:hypothetical protein [Pyrinomonadaceae bacterium]